MSLNEDYLDDLLKAVTTEDGSSEENMKDRVNIEDNMNSENDTNTDNQMTEEQKIDESEQNDMTTQEKTIGELAIEEPTTEELTTDVSDIEDLLRSIEEEDGENGAADLGDSDNQDILSMLDNMSGDGDLAEIGDLLSKDENHEAISTDVENVLDGIEGIDSHENIENELGVDADSMEQQDVGESPKKEKKKLFGKRKNKEKNDGNESDGEKKKGLFARILDIFFEEEDLGEDEPGVGEEGATEENQAIMEELDSRRKPKGKKEKAKKEKEPKKKKEPKPKKEKAPKPKKEKKVKIPDTNEKPEKKIPRKKIIMVAVFAISVFTGIFLLTSMIPETMSVQSAKKAYSDGDYKSVYTTLAGMKLRKKDEELYKKTTVILEVQNKYTGFLNYQKLGMNMEALNALLKGIERYDKLYDYAKRLSVSDELDKTYLQILTALSENYNLSEEDARQILAYDRITYTKKLDSIINGTEFIDPNAPVEEEESVPDMLPEEKALLNMSVIGGDEADQKAAQEEQMSDPLPEEETLSTEEETLSTEEETLSTEESIGELYSGSISGDNSSVDFSR
ncbi:MAG: hypothetical protein PHX08_15435 [Lachnospiraceae bacterium]|nr:hypothetical protein [Lachnospiraceae bacterium]